MTKIIGITGGIGSGKTTIVNYFKALDIPTYIADDEARKIMQSDEILKAIRNKIGEFVFDGYNLNREKLSKVVFENPDQLKILNDIVHPAVRKHFQDWIISNNGKSFVVYETAILFESGSYKNCDYVLCVTAPLELRIQRVMQRDNSTRDQVLKIIAAQWNDDQRMAKSDFVLENINPANTKKDFDKILKILNIS
jgi:dephospho-CoA kinase